jgi:hypothetical protein
MQKRQSKIRMEVKLFSARTTDVISALNLLKEQGDVNSLPMLFKLLKTNPEEEIEKEIIYILNNLKIRDAVPVLVDALLDPGYLSIRKKLTSACWENGLDYSEFLPVFTDLVIEGDWKTGFEAFTVIENMTHLPAQNILNITEEKIHEALKNADDQKKYFLHEILALIR